MIAIGDRSGSNLILFPGTSSPGLYDTIIGLCTDAGFSPVVVQEANAWLSDVGLVNGRLGITIVPAIAACACPQGVVAIPTVQTRRCTELVVVYRMGGLNPLAARFRDMARSLMSD